MEKEKTKEDIFTWTDQEIELLLETVKAYSSQCSYEERIGKASNQNMIR